MHFEWIRLHGFKSFVEPSDLVINQGLTGIVGPNGCGKSNLLEALRWVMGETSYKNMRGASMEDVIFSGTEHRPSRNIAEVILSLDNSARTAPASFNDSDQLEISRKIERDNGSRYLINGKPARARDVQLLFADASTGAHSPALVQQGRIGEIVSAKPAQRRKILEEAAGVSGLHSRRHEAELRLNAASQNMERLEDLSGQMDAQLKSLKRQARQAARHKALAHEIRQLEAARFYIQWKTTALELAEREQESRVLRGQIGQQSREEAQLRTQLETANIELQPLREKEAIAGAVLRRLGEEKARIEKENLQRKLKYEALHRQIQDQENFRQRDVQLETDALRAIKELQTEQEKISHNRPEIDEEGKKRLSENRDQAKDDWEDCQQKIAQLRQDVQQQQYSFDQNRQKHDRLGKQLEQAEATRKSLELELEQTVQVLKNLGVAPLEANLFQVTEQQKQLEESIKAKEAACTRSRVEADRAKVARDGAQLKFSGLEQEISALQELLSSLRGEGHTQLLDQLSIKPGFELAVAGAFQEDLMASPQTGSDISWQKLSHQFSNLPALPGGVANLEDQVSGAERITARLKMTGLVKSVDAGFALQDALHPGQRLVTQAGDMWRWDGLCILASGETLSAKRLRLENRSAKLADELTSARAVLTEAEEVFVAKQGEMEVLSADHLALKNAQKEVVRHLDEVRKKLNTLQEQSQTTSQQKARAEGQLEATTRQIALIAEEKKNLARAITQVEKENSVALIQREIDKLETQVQEKMQAWQSLQAEYTGLQNRMESWQKEKSRNTQELQRWHTRLQEIKKTLENSSRQLSVLQAESAEFERNPVEEKTILEHILRDIQQAEKDRQKAADAIVAMETVVKEAGQALKTSEREHQGQREILVRFESDQRHLGERLEEISHAIGEKFSCTPDALPAITGREILPVDADENQNTPFPDLADIDKQLETARLSLARLGDVNQLAEQEMAQLGEDVLHLNDEREELQQAIDKLRESILELNQEGRARLLEAFTQVNEQFRQLYKTLFNGGSADLKLIESDDPLEAGLEIYARPPGKKTQVLSLLSGGEKALTALALVFAVFLTNPSPVCVLDEVDAPLDDANVERFCNLMERMKTETDTRFMVITHHPVTMARMDRLFGVTMMEKGVSSLVSVDLETAERLRDTG